MNKYPILHGLLLSWIMLSQPAWSAEPCDCASSLPVISVYEQASLPDITSSPVTALIDTGAQTSVLDARHIRMHVNREGKRWVYFSFQHKGKRSKTTMHQPVSRIAYIKTHKGPPVSRAVVKQNISIGKISREVEVSLINRGGFPQQLLIGRNFLKGVALVDSRENSSSKGKP